MQAEEYSISVHRPHDPAIGIIEELPANVDHKAHLFPAGAQNQRFSIPFSNLSIKSAD